MDAGSGILGLIRIVMFIGWVYLLHLEALLYKFSIPGTETNNNVNNFYIVLILSKAVF